MNLFRKSKTDCIPCEEKSSNHGDLVKHVREVYHHTIVKCLEYGEEFIHEKHRLKYFKKEHKGKKMRDRNFKNFFRHQHRY